MRRFVLSFGNKAVNNKLVLAVVLGLLGYAAAILAFNIPSDIRLGLKGQAAIAMLDEARRPFLALKAAESHAFIQRKSPQHQEDVEGAIRKGRALLARYLQVASYNPAIEREVRTLSQYFEKWANAETELIDRWREVQARVGEGLNSTKYEAHDPLLSHISLMNEANELFLQTMNKLGDSEVPIHADMGAGQRASLMLLVLSVAGAAYLVCIIFLAQHIRNRTQIEAHKREIHLQRLVHIDSLTGLSNRASFYDRLATAMAMARRKHAHVALLYLDLDGFKLVNDRFGHDKGDLVLKETAVRLSACAREVDTVARMGGDEFVILLTDVADSSASVRVAEKVTKSLRRPFDLGGVAVCIGASIGIAHYPDDGERVEDLIVVADSAMYEAKKRSGTARINLAPPSPLTCPVSSGHA